MTRKQLDLEPFDTYLEEHLGSIGHQHWTDDLRETVRAYLTDEFTDDQFGRLLRYMNKLTPAGSRSEQIDFTLTQHEPYEIADAAHGYTVMWATIDQLAGSLQHWEDGTARLREDVSDWLCGRFAAMPESIRTIVHIIRRASPRVVLNESHDVFDLAYSLTAQVEPPELIRVWNQVQQTIEELQQPAKEGVTTRANSNNPIIRGWAKRQGLSVGTRGRIPSDIVARYECEQGNGQIGRQTA